MVIEYTGLASLVTSIGASLALIIKAVTTSRCSEIRTPCCSCVRVVADVVEND